MHFFLISVKRVDIKCFTCGKVFLQGWWELWEHRRKDHQSKKPTSATQRATTPRTHQVFICVMCPQQQFSVEKQEDGSSVYSAKVCAKCDMRTRDLHKALE
jgi:Zn finger protein HypA/HybF involved in hydrogenase expression